jgi:hypothetical protein
MGRGIVKFSVCVDLRFQISDFRSQILAHLVNIFVRPVP